MRDPLIQFDFETIYEQYDHLTKHFNPNDEILNKLNIKVNSDREFYYWLCDNFTNILNEPTRVYTAMMHWKLYFNRKNKVPSKLLQLYLQDDKNLRNDIIQLHSALLDNESDIDNFKDAIKLIDTPAFRNLYGVQAGTARPSRSVFLHFCFPSIVPIYDRMVRKALETEDYQKCFLQIHFLANKYFNKIKQIPDLRETPIRIIEMALWISGHH